MSSMAQQLKSFAQQEKNIYEEMTSMYDNGKFEKALELNVKVLEKHPKHPETIAMKALIIFSLKRKSEAFVIIKEQLKVSFMNFQCWYVFGLLHKNMKNYEEARKAFKMAVSFDKDNNQILLQLSYLQVQTRDYDGFAESRRLLMVKNPTNITYWITYFVATYLQGAYPTCLEVFDSIEQLIADDEKKKDLKPSELNEIYLFKVQVLEKMGEYKKAIKFMSKKTVDKIICDDVRKHETFSKLYLKNNQVKKCIESLETLLTLNSSNKLYYKQILTASEADGDEAKITEILEGYMGKFPKSNCHVGLLVELLPAGPAFKANLVKLWRPMIIKGVPSTINDSCFMYEDPKKVEIIGEVLKGMCDCMEKEMCLDPSDEEELDPTVQLWLYYFNSQHQLRLGNIDEALSYINKAIAHTPTVVELYTHKAKIMQFAGNQKQAMVLTEFARDLDQADRYLNALSSKYIFKVDEIEQAEKTMGKFSKEDADGNLNCHEMQTMWFENHCGAAHYRLGHYRESLQQFKYIEKHLEEMKQDCTDFVHYVFRKVTINHFLQMLKFEDEIYQGKYPVRCCLNMFKNVSKVQKGVKSGEITIDEVRKGYEEYKETTPYKNWKKDQEGNDDDVLDQPDPEGWENYIKAIEDPDVLLLQVATKASKVNPENAALQAKCLKFFIAKDNADLALKTAKNLFKHNSKHAKASAALELFKTYAKSAKFTDEEFAETFLEDSLGSWKAVSNAKDMDHVHELIKKDASKAGQAVGALGAGKVKTAENTHRLLLKLKKTKEADAYKIKAKEVYPYSTYFEGAKMTVE